MPARSRLAGGAEAPVNRERAYRSGRRAERLAAWWLRAKGYRILARDFRVPVGEIDLIAERGGLLAIVEVKRRERLAEALEAVTPRQQRRIERATEAYLARERRGAETRVRFDVIVIRPRRLPLHLADAWRP